MDQRCVPVSCAEIPRAAPDCVWRDYRGKLCLISFVNPLNASPEHGTASTSRQAPGGSACTGAIPGLGITELGKGHPHQCEVGKTTWRSKGKAAWRPSIPTHTDSQRGFRCPRSSPSPPFSISSLPTVKGTGFPNGAEGPACPPTPRIPSPGAAHTPSLLFGKSQPFPWHKRRIATDLNPLHLPASAAGVFKQIPA